MRDVGREYWTFDYDVHTVAEGAKIKLLYHTARLKWWEDKKKEIMETIKKEGLEIDESVAKGYSNSARDTQVLIRNDLRRDLTECVDKLNEHKEKMKEYDAWFAVLTAQPSDSVLFLTSKDWHYFFGK